MLTVPNTNTLTPLGDLNFDSILTLLELAPNPTSYYARSSTGLPLFQMPATSMVPRLLALLSDLATDLEVPMTTLQFQYFTRMTQRTQESECL